MCGYVTLWGSAFVLHHGIVDEKGEGGNTETGCGYILEQCDLEGLVTCVLTMSFDPGGISKGRYTHRARIALG